MQQLRCYGDDRNNGFCVHCGGHAQMVQKALSGQPKTTA